MALEIEYRAQLTEDEFDALADKLRQRGVDLGPDNKHIWFYVLPDKLLKVVHNISQGSGKIVVKTNRIGSGSAFPEPRYGRERGGDLDPMRESQPLHPYR